MLDDTGLDADVAEWRLALGTGRLPDPLRTRHPDLVARLRESLSAEERLVWLSGPAAALLELDPITTTTIPYYPPPYYHPPEPRGVVGDYELLQIVARGWPGEVYRARDRRDGRVVALKLTAVSPYASPLQRAEARELLRTLAGLSHPGIVRLYEWGEEDGREFLAMEFCEGGSLADRIRSDRERGRIDVREVAGLLAELADAVEYAHSHRVVHRDLKPSNVLLTSDGRPKIADFGLAMRTEPDDRTIDAAAVVGTPAYMPPEQVAGRVGPACDVYGLGVILYELLTGRVPFRGRTIIDLFEQVLHAEPDPPRRENPGVPPDLELICLRCLEKDPARRYPTARELADDLRRFLGGERIVQRRPGFFGRLLRRWR